jgi:ribonuclease T2
MERALATLAGWTSGTVLALLAAACGPEAAPGRSAEPGQPAAKAGPAAPPLPHAPAGGWPFDFWVLALSWSPTHCGEDGARERDAMQCAGPRPYAFIVHGAWPQFERGFPRSCPSQKQAPGRATVDRALTVMPSRRLIQIQWERHGTCSGLQADDYFDTVAALRARIAIPPAFDQPRDWQETAAGSLEDAFTAANPGLPADGVAV